LIDVVLLLRRVRPTISRLLTPNFLIEFIALRVFPE